MNNQKLVLLWDLHEVVFRKSWKKLAHSLMDTKESRALFKNLPKQLFSLCRSAIHAKREERKKTISIADILYLAQEEKNRALIDFVFKLSCSYTPIAQTVALITLLKNKGFSHHIGSNIAQPVFYQFKEQYPDIFSLFDYAHVVQVASRDTVIQKPDPDFFTQYLAIHKLKPQEVLFIDDKKRNIKTAHVVGLQTIHFKKPSQLEKEFYLRGIL